LALTAGTFAVSGAARVNGTPFYITPPARTVTPTECQNLSYCYGVRGPWVVVPAHGEATFLFGCPEQAAAVGGYLLGGTDALASSSHVYVWYDSRLGTPLAAQTPKTSTTGLLFHAVTDNGQQGAFQPILGCIELAQASKVATVSAVRPIAPAAATRSALPPKMQAMIVELEPGWDRTIALRCFRDETLVGGWSAVAFGTGGPPALPQPVTVKTSTENEAVHVDVRTAASVPYPIQIQVGVMCEP
jgi:hypothetical protein